MATEKFTNEKTVKIETSKASTEPVSDLSVFLPKKSIAHKVFKLFSFGFILLVTLLSLIKIPYCGSYTDAYIFEFVFGTFTKFFVYLFLIIFCLAKMIDFKYSRFMTSKTFVLA
jgi:type III secretory pathway component EscU